MSIMDITLAYLWFVLAASCVFFLLRFLDPEVQKSWDEVKLAWRNLDSADEQQRALECDFSQVEASIARLLRSGFHAAILVIRHTGSKRFIQFHNYIHDVGDFGIELGFPNVAWAQDYFPKLRAHCEENDIPYRIRTQTDGGDCEILCVNCGQDLHRAQGLARAIWTKIFGLSEHAQHGIEQRWIHPFGDVIDRPDQGPLSFKLGSLHKKSTGLPSFPAVMVVGLLTLLRPIALFGLLITLLSSVGEAPHWSLQLGAMTLSGTLGSLVFLFLFLVSSWARLYFQTKNRQPRTWIDVKISPTWSWIVIITLPISSILVWTGG